MNINKSTTTSELQKAFKASFPYLRINFYTLPHDHFHGSLKKDEVVGDQLLSALNPNLKDGTLAVEGSMSVDNFETLLEEEFGLHVQVFRKSGDQWLQTSVTDHWTLNAQNSKAAEQEAYSN